MNHCKLEQNAFMSREDLVVCPKPRRVCLLSNNFIHPLRFHMIQAATDLSDSKAGAELFDIIRRKLMTLFNLMPPLEEDKETIGQLLSSSPPYFSGSPPSRAVNPLAQDARFRDEKLTPVSPNSPLLHPNFIINRFSISILISSWVC
ncbi:hypothetical protein Bca4012_024109 [Brassica carinata]|uniref:Uncharacterized protein n=1 Tax=Brassica carinata TaxID=52824 RepID=A0A8X7TEK8_BRACI|nr:hypothetical protein Bca52824_091970 [Brassica carinata]